MTPAYTSESRIEPGSVIAVALDTLLSSTMLESSNGFSVNSECRKTVVRAGPARMVTLSAEPLPPTADNPDKRRFSSPRGVLEPSSSSDDLSVSIDGSISGFVANGFSETLSSRGE